MSVYAMQRAYTASLINSSGGLYQRQYRQSGTEFDQNCHFALGNYACLSQVRYSTYTASVVTQTFIAALQL